MKNKIIDLFCGCGGLSMGFEKAGFEVCYAVDMWEKAIATFNHNHKGEKAHCLDIHDLTDEYDQPRQGGDDDHDQVTLRSRAAHPVPKMA